MAHARKSTHPMYTTLLCWSASDVLGPSSGCSSAGAVSATLRLPMLLSSCGGVTFKMQIINKQAVVCASRACDKCSRVCGWRQAQLDG